MNIMYYVTLSIYRIRRTNGNLALFVTFATINAIYSCRYNPSPLPNQLTLS